MLTRTVFAVFAAGLVALLTPADARAWGAAHVGYTHVGPNGVYHTGSTVAAGPGGVYAGGRTTAYGSGGGAYHSGYSYGAGAGGVSGGAVYGGYRYTPSYSGGAAYGGYRYGYVR